MPGYINVDAAITEANRLLKVRKENMAALDIVRTDLRNAVTLGQANDAQAKFVRETFPKRERKAKKG